MGSEGSGAAGGWCTTGAAGSVGAAGVDWAAARRERNAAMMSSVLRSSSMPQLSMAPSDLTVGRERPSQALSEEGGKGRTAMARAPDRSRDAAVSSVVGTVLMLGITMAVFAGFSVVVVDRVTDDAQQGVRATLGAEVQEDRVLLRHRGGEPLLLAEGTLLLTVGGASVEQPLSAASSQVADGATWRIGESLCIAGPQPPCLHPAGAIEDVKVRYGPSLAFAGLATGGQATALVRYVASGSAAAGTLVSFASAQSAIDGGAEAVLQEGGTAQPAGSVGPVKASGTPSSAGGVTNPSNAAASDDVVAELDATGDTLDVSGFDLPADAATVTAVTIGYEGRKDGTGGVSPTTRLDYKRSSDSTFSTGTAITESATADTDRTRTLAGSFSVADVEGMTVRVTHVDDTNRNPLIDHVFVLVTYTTSPSTHYALDAGLDFADVPAATTPTLELRYRTSGDTFRVQVWDGSSFVTRGTALDSASSATWSYALGTAEWNGGAPRIRIVDATPAGTTQGNLFLDYVRVVAA